jgi:hypothetical protein
LWIASRAGEGRFADLFSQGAQAVFCIGAHCGARKPRLGARRFH